METEILLVRDRLDIMEVLALYHHRIDAKDWQGLGALFADDIVAEYHALDDKPLFGLEGSHSGRAAVVDWICQGQEPFRFNGAPTHFMTNHVVTVAGDEAWSTSYFLDVDLLSGLVIGTGLYRCEHRRTDGAWRIARLRLEQRLCDDVVARISTQREKNMEDRPA